MVIALREIGSEFWDVPVCNKKNGLFSDSTQWFLSGRSALQAVIREIKRQKDSHTVAMPAWCCDSMIKPFVDAGINVQFYPVYWDKGFIREISLECDVLFLIDYFGYTANEPDLNNYQGIVIRDVTHSIFSAEYKSADYTFGSLRKWCGVWTGGFAWASDGSRFSVEQNADHEYADLRKKAMLQKAEYISGKRADKEYLKIFERAENALDQAGILPASDRDVRLTEWLDKSKIKEKRRINANVLRISFPDLLMFPDLKDTDCPMFVPIIVPDASRDQLRHYLINNEIYCPVHWPVSEYHKLSKKEKYIYDNEISLVCDQRYTEEDMYRMVDVIKKFWKEM